MLRIRRACYAFLLDEHVFSLGGVAGVRISFENQRSFPVLYQYCMECGPGYRATRLDDPFRLPQPSRSASTHES
jgi:hypothetical protein